MDILENELKVVRNKSYIDIGIDGMDFVAVFENEYLKIDKEKQTEYAKLFASSPKLYKALKAVNASGDWEYLSSDIQEIIAEALALCQIK